MTDVWDNEGGAMAHIRKGYSIALEGLCFEFQGKVVHVYGQERMNHVASFSLIDNDGLPVVNTQEDFQAAVLWWLYDNDKGWQ